MKNFEVKKSEIIHITIKIGDKEHKLTVEEAKALLLELDKAVGVHHVFWPIPTQPAFVPAPIPQPIYIGDPPWPNPFAPTFYCKTGNQQ